MGYEVIIHPYEPVGDEAYVNILAL